MIYIYVTFRLYIYMIHPVYISLYQLLCQLALQSSLLVTTETGVEALLLPPVALRGDCAAVEVSVRSPEIRVVAP